MSVYNLLIIVEKLAVGSPLVRHFECAFNQSHEGFTITNCLTGLISQDSVYWPRCDLWSRSRLATP